ncbi:hypothetical protein [Lacihabitans soyangensis]|uniref:Uncharacterized protein n=1 Tax=Lacihabitans soyangensis TaxID=869394 RepID=A0AAE3H879_9BACT|nr:hypothetical protein [Lacihabitans soyangensis]MCP9764955.1 hypothetical protein [Lacihabitans soyangensis]
MSRLESFKASSISSENMASAMKKIGKVFGKTVRYVDDINKFIAGNFVGNKLPRKAKKAYIAKYGRAEYRKMYFR